MLDGFAWIGLGGHPADSASDGARVFFTSNYGQSWQQATTGLTGTESAGVFSLCFLNKSQGVAVGGDYLKPDSAQSVLSITRDGGRSWSTPAGHGLRGFRSSVAMTLAEGKPILIACGPTGCDWSADAGEHWHPLSNEGFHAIDFSADHKTGWAVGADGRMAMWVPAAK